MNKGFTLIELIVVVAIVGILVSLVTPVLNIYQSRKQDQAISKLVQSIKLTRNEAVKRNTWVTLRIAGSSWQDGWVSFVDTNGDGLKGTSELISLSSHKLKTNLQLANGSGFTNYLRFSGAGTVNNKGWLIVTNDADTTLKDAICIESSGRTSISNCPTASDPCEFVNACP